MINLLPPFLGHTEVLCGESGTLGSKTPSNKPAKLVTIYQQEVQKCLRKLTGIEGGRMHDPSNCTTPSNCTSNFGGCESKHGVKVYSPGKLMIILCHCVSQCTPFSDKPSIYSQFRTARNPWAAKMWWRTQGTCREMRTGVPESQSIRQNILLQARNGTYLFGDIQSSVSVKHWKATLQNRGLVNHGDEIMHSYAFWVPNITKAFSSGFHTCFSALEARLWPKKTISILFHRAWHGDPL